MKLGEINWILVIVAGIFAIYGLKGYREGFIRTIFGMFSVILALGAGSLAGPILSEAIKSNERVLPYITQNVNEEELSLPELLRSTLKKNNSEKDFKKLAVDRAEDYVKVQLANWVINALAFILVFLATYLLLWYICHALDIISKLPLINGLNKTAGILVGILRGFITIWLLCIALTIFSATQLCQTIFGYINDSVFLSLIYNNNLLFEFGKILL